ncbi:MAG: DNA topoisomerase IV subunit A [SAR324 cluster bacterium]|nr:DNA topoisomerase IV subunit A [SAR324 cluster bacterium]
MRYLKPLMDQNFLEYASYVIKDRAIPDIEDGLKPVQRRILYTMMKMDDGKFNKVANVIGECMKLHPHGDASIGSALVVLANKEYFIEKQGNFGNIFTGDPASAARYIEARLTPLAKEVLFHDELTQFVESYDGRNKEPVTLPCKIPATLLLGAEGIAVGMSTRILPHNFCEVLEAQIAHLQGKPFALYPDFQTGGEMDVSAYQEGAGKIRVRAMIEVVDDKTLVIREVPFGVTTEALIQSVQEAVNKGKFKLSSINDFTTDQVEIELKTGRTGAAASLLKPLYAFTLCEVSITVNLLVIQNNQPVQISVSDVLKYNTDQLLKILEQELRLSLKRTRLQWHHKRLEMYFISQKIYQKLEKCETYEEVVETVWTSLKPLQKELEQEITREDAEKLLSIQIKRLSKFDIQHNQQELEKLTQTIDSLEKSLRDVKQYTINYLKQLLKQYGKDYPRKTRIEKFASVQLREIAAVDLKVGWDTKEGYLGTDIKTESSILCSSYDRLIIFFKDGRYKIVRIPEKMFLGKDVILVEKLDPALVYNLVYYASDNQICYAKRFHVEKYILDKDYHLFDAQKGAGVVHFSKGSGIMLEVFFVQNARSRKTRELFSLDEQPVKAITARGNRVSPKPVAKVKPTNQVNNNPQPNLV